MKAGSESMIVHHCEKVYISRNTSLFTTDRGVLAKWKKNLNSTELVNTIDEFVTSNFAIKFFEDLSCDKIIAIKNGVNLLKQRIQNRQSNSLSFFSISSFIIETLQKLSDIFFPNRIQEKTLVEKLQRTLLIIEEKWIYKRVNESKLEIECWHLNLVNNIHSNIDMKKLQLDIEDFDDRTDKEINWLTQRSLEIKKELEFIVGIPLSLNRADFSEKKDKKILKILGYSSEDHYSEYIQYIRKVIFGFSIGQKLSLSYFQHKKWDLFDLEKACEGGYHAAHMFYITLFLLKFLAEFKNSSKDCVNLPPSTAVSRLKDDLQRSLVFAFLIHEEKTADSLFEEMLFDELIKMAPGEKIFIPIIFKQNPLPHATLLVFEKMENKKIKPTYYDTNGGSIYHLIENPDILENDYH